MRGRGILNLLSAAARGMLRRYGSFSFAWPSVVVDAGLMPKHAPPELTPGMKCNLEKEALEWGTCRSKRYPYHQAASS